MRKCPQHRPDKQPGPAPVRFQYRYTEFVFTRSVLGNHTDEYMIFHWSSWYFAVHGIAMQDNAGTILYYPLLVTQTCILAVSVHLVEPLGRVNATN